MTSNSSNQRGGHFARLILTKGDNMRNISDECKTCKDNHFDMAMCIDICGIPMDILDEIERKRIKEEEKKEHDTKSI